MSNRGVQMFLFYISWTVALSAGTSFVDKKSLHTYIRQQSDVDIKPLLNQSETPEVRLQLVIASIQGLDEKTQVLSSRISIVSVWMSDTLRWNLSDYAGITYVKLSPGDIWVPNIGMYNAEKNQMFEYRDIQITLYNTGRSTWTVAGNFDTTCKVDVTYYPFDVQVCPLQFGELYSEIQTFNTLPLVQYVDQSFYVPNDVWDLTATRITTESYPLIAHTRLVVELTLARKPGFYVINVIVPVVLLSFMNILSFKIPAASGERVGYCVALFLTFMVLLGSISDSMPKVASISVLQLYINVQLAVGMVITALSITLVNASTNGDGKTVSRLVGILCCLGYHTKTAPVQPEAADNKESRGGYHGDKMDTPPPYGVKHLVDVLDKRLFIAFMIMFLLTNVVFLSCFLLRP